MPNTIVTIRMDSNLKKQADELFNELGLTFSSAINIFVRQSIREQKIPFEIAKSKEIQFANIERLKQASEESDTKYKEVYEELAK